MIDYKEKISKYKTILAYSSSIEMVNANNLQFK